MSDPSMESSLTYENCSIFNQSANFSNPPYNIAGQKYETHEDTLKAVKEKFWFTYRSNFEPLIDPKILKENEEAKEKVKEKVSDDEKILDSPDLKKSLEETSSYLSNYMNSYTGDAGWGCAVRVGQMLLAECYRRILNTNDENRTLLLNKFNDKLSANFSFQNLVLQFKHSDKNYKIGTWLGPNNVCHSLTKLINLQNELKEENWPVLRSFVCMDSTVVVPEIPNFKSQSASSTSKSSATSQSPILILIPLRLGLEHIYADTYRDSLLSALSLPQSVGFIGGRPRAAYYFFGHSQSSKELLCLDPHTVQSHHPKIDESNMSEYSCENPLIINSVDSLDPSLALGFLCKCQNDLENLLDELEKLNLVAVMRSIPDFGFPDSDEEGEGTGNDGTNTTKRKKSDFDLPDTDDEFEILTCSQRDKVEDEDILPVE